jgi:hypothetical protein
MEVPQERAVKCYNYVHSNFSIKIRARAKAGLASFRSLCWRAAGARLSPAEIRVLPAEIEVPPAEIEVRKLKFTYSKLKLEFLRVNFRTVLSCPVRNNNNNNNSNSSNNNNSNSSNNNNNNNNRPASMMPTTIAIAKRGRFCRSNETTISNGVSHPSSAAGLAVSMLRRRQQQQQQQL